jgi:hypothetical protein
MDGVANDMIDVDEVEKEELSLNGRKKRVSYLSSQRAKEAKVSESTNSLSEAEGQPDGRCNE